MFPLKDLINNLINYIRNPIEDRLIEMKDKIVEKLDKIIDVIAAYGTYIEQANYKAIDYIRPEYTDTEVLEHEYELPPNQKYEYKFRLSSTYNYDALVLVVRAHYDPNAEKGVEVRWFYSPGYDLFDSLDDALEKKQYERLSFAPGETRQRTIIIPAITHFVLVQILNLDPNCSVKIDILYHFVRLNNLLKI